MGHAQNMLPDRAISGHVTDVTSGQKAPTKADIAQLRRTYFRTGHVTDVTSGQKASLRRILRNFRLRMRRTHFRHFRSLPLAPPQMLTELYPYTTLDYPIIASDQFNVYHFKATFFNLCSANHISFYVLYTFCKFPIIRGLCYDKLLGTYKVRNEIETKRNQRKRNETKRNQRNKTKPTKAKRNQRNRLI
jgi:hypothetical protein